METITLLLLFGFFFIYVCLKLFVSKSQSSFLENFETQNITGWDRNELDEAKKYALAKEEFSLKESLVELAIFSFWIFLGLKMIAPLLTSNSLALQTVGIVVFLGVAFIFELPIKYMHAFDLDKKFGFSVITKKLFWSDRAKELLITALLAGALGFVGVYFIANFESWWFFLFLTLAFFIVAANIVYPNFIAPMFNKFEDLDDTELKETLTQLAQKSGFTLENIYKIDAGKRDTRLNAYFAGIGKTKKVALYDTLLQKLPKSQICAVIGHELGHFRLGHLKQSIGAMFAMFFLFCFVLGHIPKEIYEALGLAPTGGSVVVLFLIFSAPAMYVFMPLINGLYKKNEYEADNYAASLGYKTDMVSALKTLAKENKAFPFASKIKIFFDYTHPPITERIKRLEGAA